MARPGGNNAAFWAERALAHTHAHYPMKVIEHRKVDDR